MRRLLAAATVLAAAVLALAAALDERPVAFERVRLVVGTFGRPGPPLRVAVTGGTGGEVAGGYADNSTVEAAVGEVPAGGRLRVCVRNAGRVPVGPLGSPPGTPPHLLGDPNLE